MSDPKQRRQPLAYRMAPQKLSEYVGQSHLLGKGKLLRRMIEADQLQSILLYGPPGTGKTSLARVIAQTTALPFKRLNAVTAGVSELKQTIEQARNPLLTPEGRVVLFIDEIHRFNKLQQDALLPAVEEGLIILIGATTENPFFEVNKALVSRATLFKLEPLSQAEIQTILNQALTDPRGYAGLPIKVSPEAMAYWTNRSNGDARIALNALELAVSTTPPNAAGEQIIDLEVAQACIQMRAAGYDATGDAHYDTISALIKSIRGSDPDAALFYLGLALSGGEDLSFLARRLVISAAEDIGMAQPMALMIAQAGAQAVRELGLPEARIPLAEVTVFLACSPKSNAAYQGINEVLADLRAGRTGSIPMHLRNAPLSGMQEAGYGVGYQYAHEGENHFVLERYLPDEWLGRRYYRPSDQGYEGKQIKQTLSAQRQERDQVFGTLFDQDGTHRKTDTKSK